jgi:CheY-like chemotaxis protein/DNA-binding CsgD family transcriptional regulator
MARVLVVDDEAQVRDLVRMNLELDGHDVLEACDGVEALDVLRLETPDLVVLDVMMPRMDGWAVLSTMKNEDSALAEIPVLMLTARVAEVDRIRGGIEGAVRYITKPFSLDALVQAVDDALAGGPEPVQRRQAQRAALQQLAVLEKGGPGPDQTVAAARPRLTRLEHAPYTPGPAAGPFRPLAAKVAALSPKQHAVLAAVGGTESVQDAATQLAVSRSNVYASLARIARKLGVRGVAELTELARQGAFVQER